MNRIQYALQRFFSGRNGYDQLALAALILGFVVAIVSSVTGFVPLAALYLACILYSVFRMLSPNTAARQRENRGFLAFWGRVAAWFRLRVRMVREIRTHKYFKCPKCRTRLRVPRGKGKIAVTCKKCGQSTVKKT